MDNQIKFEELKAQISTCQSSFQAMINNGQIFVDKTDYIYDLCVDDNFKFLSRDESYWYYVTELPTQSLSKEQQETLNSTEEIVKIDNIILSDGKKTYEVSGELFSQIVFFGDLINDYLLMLTRSNSMNYKVRKSMDYVQFSKFPSDIALLAWLL